MEEVIKMFLSVSSGDGSGKGSGYGYGDGSGNGSGDVYGYGDDSGDGSGEGYGDGYGDGTGFGDGDGTGYGYSDGYGYGYNDGIKKYGEQTVYIVDDIQTLIYSVHDNYAKGAIINSDLTLSPCFIAKEDDCFAHGETLQDAVIAVHAKTIQNLSSEEDRIDKFLQEYPDKNKKYLGREFFEWHHTLTGSCKMGRKQFCKDNNIDINAEYTPMEFLNLCKNSFGGDVIKLVIDKYNNVKKKSH